MARNLDKLSKDKRYLLLAEEVDLEAAIAIKNEGVSGGTLVDLTDSELTTLLPKPGPRRMVKMLDDNFQRDSPSQPKVKPSHCIDTSMNCIGRTDHEQIPSRINNNNTQLTKAFMAETSCNHCY